MSLPMPTVRYPFRLLAGHNECLTGIDKND